MQTLPLYANPVDGVVSAGEASISAQGATTTITQATDKAVIDWRGFDIAKGETTEFKQPSSSSMTLNRVNSSSPSFIDGALTANGNLVVVNPNGVWFGGNARVDVNGLIASTAGISNDAFMNHTGMLVFDQAGDPGAAIVNDGVISAGEAGLVGLVAPNVVNRGVILAKLGRVALASGDTATVDLYGDGLVQVAVSDKVQSQLVSNSGLIAAPGGTIALTAGAGKNIVNSLIHVAGELAAPSISQKNGTIIIAAAGSNAVKGNNSADKGKKSGASTVAISGILDASGRNAGERGGRIEVTGDNIALLDGTRIDASGSDGASGTTFNQAVSAYRTNSAGGDIRIGGDYLGQGDTPTALNLYVDADALILNDALNSGDAGRTIFWSDNTTSFYGNVYARALGGKPVDASTWNATSGGNTGDGGFVETSGHVALDVGGYVDLTSSSGQRGTYFLDPTNITIYGNFAPNYATVIQGDSTALSTNLKLWLDASDTANVNLTYNSLGTTATGTSGTNTITVSSNTGLTVGARIRLGGAGSVTAASTLGSDTYTISAIAGTTITLSSNLTANYTTSAIYQGYISKLSDKSGSGNNATQGTAANMPLWISNGQNGLGVGYFNGSSSYLTLPNLMSGAAAGSGFFTAVNDFDPSVTSTSAGHPFGNWGTGIQSHYVWTDGVIYDSFGASVRLTTGNPVPSLTTVNIYSVISATNNWRNFVNDQQLYSTSSNTVAWGSSPLIGLNSGFYYRGKIGEMFTYNTAVSTSARQLLDQYQSARWNVVLLPPGSGATEAAQATASIQKGDTVDGYSVFTTRYLERLSQSANISLQASNNITLDLQGDTLNFTTAGRSLTLTAGNQITTASTGTITTNNGGISLTATGGIAINNSFTLNSQGGSIGINSPTAIASGATLTINDGGSSNTVSSVISGAGALTKAGSGMLTLSGANTYTGATTVSGGTLAINNSGGVSTNVNISGQKSLTTSAINVASGAIASLSFGTNVGSTNTGLTLSGAGTIRLVSNSSWWLGGPTAGTTISMSSGGLIDIQAGVFKNDFGNVNWSANQGDLNLAAGTTLDLRTSAPSNNNVFIGSLTGTGTVDALYPSANTITVGVGNATSTFDGVILSTSASVNLIKTGTGTLTLTGANTYTGTTTISGGALQIGNGGTTGALGTGAVTNNASLVFNRSNALSVSNNISGTGSLTQSGSGTLTLSGTNTYSGGTNLTAGTLNLASSGALGSSGTLSFGGGTLQYSASNTTDYSARFSAAGSQPWSIDTNGQSVTFANILAGTGSSLTKLGTGTLILTGANTYSGGTTVNAGTLQIGNGGTTGALGTGALVIGAGTLAYNLTGTFNTTLGSSLTLNNGATISVISGAITLTSTATGTTATSINGSVTLSAAGGASFILQSNDINANAKAYNIASGATINTSGTVTINGTQSGTAGSQRAFYFSGAATFNSTSGTLAINAISNSADIAWMQNNAAVTFNGAVTLTVKSGYQDALCNANACLATAPAITVGSNSSLSIITTGSGSGNGMNITGATWTVGASSTLSYSGLPLYAGSTGTFTVNGAGGLSIASNLALPSAGILTIANAASVTITGAVSGTGALTKSGAGTLTLSGANTYTGATTVSGGMVTLSGSWNVGAGTATTSVASGATLNGAGVITAATLAHSGAGTLSLTGNNLVGTLSASGTTGNITFNNAQSLSLGTITSSGAIVITATGATSDMTITAGQTITANGTGTALTLVAGRNFINNAGSGALATPSGRWLVYSTNPANDTIGSLSNAFRRFSCTYGGACPSFPGSGNGFLYTTTPILTITPNAVGSIVYGAAAPVLSGYAYTVTGGYLGSDGAADMVTGTLNGSSSYIAGSNIGTYNINYGSGTLTSAMGYGFSYANNASAITVTPRLITIAADTKTKVYGSADPTLTYQITVGSLYGSDTFTGALSRVAGENVGSYSITQNTLSAGSNYTISYTGNNLSITPYTLSVSAASKTKVYGSADPTLTYSYGSLQNGDTASVFTGALSRVAGENVGSYAITQNTLSAGSNYTISYTGNNLSITPYTLSVSAASKTKVYGSADPTLTYSYGSLQNGDTASVFTGALSRVAGENVGSYAITQNTLSAGSNYTISYTGNNLSITRAALTVTANAQSKTYGNADPSLTYSYSGLKLSDTASVFTGTLSRVAGENVGSYAITQNTLSAGGNYTISYTGNNLSITRAALTVTANAQSKTYGNADPSLTYSYSGLKLSDTASVFTGALSRVAGENVGSYAINQNTLAASSNYTISYTGNNLTINPVVTTVTVSTQTKINTNDIPVTVTRVSQDPNLNMPGARVSSSTPAPTPVITNTAPATGQSGGDAGAANNSGSITSNPSANHGSADKGDTDKGSTFSEESTKLDFDKQGAWLRIAPSLAALLNTPVFIKY